MSKATHSKFISRPFAVLQPNKYCSSKYDHKVPPQHQNKRLSDRLFISLRNRKPRAQIFCLNYTHTKEKVKGTKEARAHPPIYPARAFSPSLSLCSTLTLSPFLFSTKFWNKKRSLFFLARKQLEQWLSPSSHFHMRLIDQGCVINIIPKLGPLSWNTSI